MLRNQQEQYDSVVVTFSLPVARQAGRVYLVGDFNGWSESATPMSQTRNGWETTLSLPRGHSYEYRYLVDGTTWLNDWNADHYVPNDLGGDNSVILT
jgi:1,4-alpha-glucan branching enzyme